MTHRAVLTLALVWLVSASRADAQERLALYTKTGDQPRYVEVDVSPGGFGRVVAVTPLTHVPPVDSGPFPVAGGRYLAWIAPSVTRPAMDLYAFDRRTRTVVVAPPSLLPPASIGASYYLMASDPNRPRLFLWHYVFQGGTERRSAWIVDLTGAPARELVRTASSNGMVLDVAYADAVDELFVSVTHDPLDNRIDVVDATSGTLKRRLPVMAPFSFSVDPFGQRVYGNHSTPTQLGFAVLDGQTGALRSMINGTYLWGQQFDRERGILFVTDSPIQRVGAVDPVTLAPIGLVDLGAPSQPYSRQFLPGRDAVGGFVVTTRTHPVTRRCESVSIDRLGPDGRRQASAEILPALLPVGTGCGVTAFLLQPPPAPSARAATVTGSTVTLSWTLAGDATSAELEFGFAPGQRAGAIGLGASTTLTIPGVPPGTYYLRVRGINELGAGRASADLRVVVP